MSVLVVGGAGYIGSHVVKLLRNNKKEVIVFDNLEKGYLKAIGDTTFYRGDLRNKAEVKGVFKKYDIDSVMHFSAYALVGESMQLPEIYYENNIYGTLNLLTAMKEAGVKYFVFSSTAAVYGEPVHTPIDEEHPKTPTNVYGETKLAVEKMLDWFDMVYQIKSVRFRYFNAAGADPSGEIGELHDPETHIIPIILQTCLGERESLSVFGDDYPTTDGTCVRDYIHVCDLSDAHILALDYLQSGEKSTVFNLGNGNGYSVKEVIETACRVTGSDIPFKIADRRAGDPAVLIASSVKAKEVLGWKPKFHELETIVKTAWNWHSANGKSSIRKK